uniref:Uncharacterized protein n=1 Tax=Graphocephala atropunctata TaxID=36148 RepID=A0A1B6LH14_9HEMI
MLEKTVGFHNPSNVACLSSVMGLGNLHHTNIVPLKGRFPEAEYATELRSVQAAKWAFRSVADGIEHFKANRLTEAFQCLNKALSIDGSNIEGLVARGALFANGGSFKKAIDDFECALKLNHNHMNARKYMGETLVAYGRSFEDKNQMEDALKCYEKCLEVVPYHDEAHNSIEFIKTKMANGSVSMTDGLVTSLAASKAQGVKDTLKHLLGTEPPAKDEVTGSAKKKKKEKKAKKHKRHSSSSSSSSSSGSSSSSSSSSSSDSSSASSNDSHRKKKHKSRKSEPKEKSLSPLSKRMAIMDTSAAETDGARGSHYNPPAMPYSFSSVSVEQVSAASAYPAPASAKSDKESEYEQRVCKFLEQTKGDSDYEEKVRKFLDETAKWKKERKAIEEKAKKKRKKEKKARSKSKKKKRDERKKKKIMKEIEEKKLREVLRKQRRRSNVDEEDEFLYGEKPDLRLSLPDLEDLQSKLSYYVKAEKGNSSKKKEKSSSVEHLVAAAQVKTKIGSPKMLYLHDDDKEETRQRKIEKKKMDMFEDSPPLSRSQDAKNVPLPTAPPPPSAKFKMQIGAAQNRLKKREKGEDKDSWDDGGEKRFIYVNEGSSSKEPEPKKLPEKKKEIEDQMAKVPMVLDKLGGFRINPLNAEKKSLEPDRSQAPTPQKRKLRPRVSESDSSDSDVVVKKKERPRSPGSSRSRSRSRSHKKYSSDSPPPKKYSSSSSRSPSYRKDRSRSKSGSYRSRSNRRYRSSESGSYRTRSRSRSRSRSMDYHRRSRSHSDDRHHYRKYPGRYPRNRGTYYRPRFPTGFKTRPGGYFPRGRGGPWRPGGRPFIPRMRGRGRPRFFHYNNKPRDDRYQRRYERDISRSDDDDGSPMRKVILD